MNTVNREKIIHQMEDILDTPHSNARRSFLRTCASAGIGLLGIGAFLESCAEKEKEVAISSGLVQAYGEKLAGLMREVRDRELPNIQKAASLCVLAKLEGHELYDFMSGGMLTGELSNTRPGSPLIFLPGDITRPVRYDYIITNDPYAVRGLNERLVKIIGITRPSLVSNETPDGALANMGTFRLEDVAEVVIYSHVPPADGILEVNGINFPIGPASGIIHAFLFHALAAEIAEGIIDKGVYPRIG
jgi:hypothetical protein